MEGRDCPCGSIEAPACSGTAALPQGLGVSSASVGLPAAAAGSVTWILGSSPAVGGGSGEL